MMTDIKNDISNKEKEKENEKRKEFGKKLKDLRKEKRRTLDEASKEIGISLSALSNYESGYRTPADITTTEKIAKYYEVTIDYLYGLTNDKNCQVVQTTFFDKGGKKHNLEMGVNKKIHPRDLSLGEILEFIKEIQELGINFDFDKLK